MWCGAAPTNGDAHPIWCLEAAADEVEQWAPDLLVVKGDLAHNNLPGEYDAVAKVLSGIGRPCSGCPATTTVATSSGATSPPRSAGSGSGPPTR
ncbi:MAG: metallophosphoesterase [Ilumatobacteraceae bacterium]